MSAENKAIVRRLMQEAINQKNLDIIEELVAPDFVNHTAPPGTPPTREAWKKIVARMGAALPDAHLYIEDEIAEGDRVTTRFTFQGTHRGELMGISATGKTVNIGGIHIARVVNGKIVERWEEIDKMSMMVQIGAIAPPGG